MHSAKSTVVATLMTVCAGCGEASEQTDNAPVLAFTGRLEADASAGNLEHRDAPGAHANYDQQATACQGNTWRGDLVKYAIDPRIPAASQVESLKEAEAQREPAERCHKQGGRVNDCSCGLVVCSLDPNGDQTGDGPCSAEECGDQPSISPHVCQDGSHVFPVGVCSRSDSGACFWNWSAEPCPEDRPSSDNSCEGINEGVADCVYEGRTVMDCIDWIKQPGAEPALAVASECCIAPDDREYRQWCPFID